MFSGCVLLKGIVHKITFFVVVSWIRFSPVVAAISVPPSFKKSDQGLIIMKVNNNRDFFDTTTIGIQGKQEA